jgi:3-phenylpropionate/cinnamic acid dioxygenase small subunit
MSTKLTVMDSARQIENLLYTYAERIDAGDLDGVADLFEHGRICGVENGPPETVFIGVERVRQMYEMATRLYDDGTSKTKHLTSNVQVYVDDDAGTARATAYYCVTQATPDLPLQIIVTGHYRDTFHRIDGRWWFDSRTMYVDQVGDTSHHLKF